MVTSAAIHALHALGIATVIAVVGASGLGIVYCIHKLSTQKSSASTN